MSTKDDSQKHDAAPKPVSIIDKRYDWPKYLDDNGDGDRCYLLYHLALTRGEAEKRIVHLGFEVNDDGWLAAEVSVVWMKPGVGGRGGEEWYDEVPEGTEGAMRYWKFSW